MIAGRLYITWDSAEPHVGKGGTGALLLFGLLFNGQAFGAIQIPVSAVHTYSIPVLQTARHEFRLTRMEGGQRNQVSWKLLLPGFLQWAYPVIPH
jgi:hypothetical protein